MVKQILVLERMLLAYVIKNTPSLESFAKGDCFRLIAGLVIRDHPDDGLFTDKALRVVAEMPSSVSQINTKAK